MDVTCERCRTSYDFDETLVGKGGTTVKCTSCGHLFKVFPSSSAAATAGWRVRRSNGAIEEIGSLRDLQQRIVRGDLVESDAISRAGQAWKPLGAIDELRGFFRQARASDPPPPPGRSTLPFAAGAPPVDDEATRRVSIDEISRAVQPEPPTQVRPRPKSTLFGVGGQGPGVPTPAPRPIPPPPRRSVPPPPPPPAASLGDAPTMRDIDLPGGRPSMGGAATTTPSRPAAFERTEPGMRVAPPAQRSTPPAPPPPSSRAEGRASVPTHIDAPASKRPMPPTPTPKKSIPPARPNRPRLRLDVEEGAPVEVDIDPVDLPQRRAWPWIVLAAVAAIGGVAAWQWGAIVDRIAAFQQGDAGAEDLAKGEEALAHHDRAGFVQALDFFGAAASAASSDPRVHEALSRAHAAFAQTLAFEASDLAARSLNDPTMEEAIGRLRREQADHATQARAAAEEATRLAPDRKSAKLALADALRLAGVLTPAKDALANADRLAGTDGAYAHLVRAGIAIAEANGDVTAGRAEAERAVTLEPPSIAARLLFARTLLAAGDVARAQAEIAAVLALRPGHSAATDLADAIARGIPPAPPVVQVLDGGVAAAAADAGVVALAPVEPAAPTAAPIIMGPAVTIGPSAGRPAPAAPVAAGTSAPPPPGRDYGWYVDRGDEFLERGNIGQARTYFEAALVVRSSGPEALTGLGYVALNGGDAAGAVRRFEPASRSGYSDALIGLGDAYRRLGRNADALRTYQQYLERRPTGPQATIAQRQIDALRAQGGAPESPPATPPPAAEAPPPTPPPAAEAPPPAEAPPTAPTELPAPRDTPPSSPPPSSDPPAIGTE